MNLIRDEMKQMSKQMNELSMQVSEKEAEIIRLNMNLNDERAWLNKDKRTNSWSFLHWESSEMSLINSGIQEKLEW